MKTRILQALFFILLFCCYSTIAQNKYEREYRIKKSQFPEEAIILISEKLEGAKRLKFYKETDSAKTSFEAKFKKDRLWYSVEFDESGKLEDIEILVKEVDLPSDTYSAILKYLDKSFSKYRIKKIQQQYPTNEGEELNKTIKNAFQNLILPSINYELIIGGKKNQEYFDYEILFDSQGNFIRIRKSLPPNYDHVLY
ncbi:hypothetical protein [Maribacter aestuarii]|uniref:hypothetical protein n=1 Tax=Maribacter aestuarii TaxID=1130723 RepID=UPI0025A508F3|nr:hypothetical protein [Maribacter aestuarii]